MKLFVTKFRVAWAHCDAAGIVFYPHYYVWFDQGTEHLFTAEGLSYPELQEKFGVSGMPLLETGARYQNPCKLGIELEVTSWLAEISGKTFLMKHRIVRDDGIEALEGFERRALVKPDPSSPRGIRAIAFPEAIRSRFED